MSNLKQVLEDIEKSIKEGATIYTIDYGKSIGPTCDHCGKTGIDLVAVLAVPKDEDPHDDSMQYTLGLFGKTCFKKTGIKAKKI